MRKCWFEVLLSRCLTAICGESDCLGRSCQGRRLCIMSSERITDAIYLDFNATTPILLEVLDAMFLYLCEGFGNLLSDHV